MKIKILVATHKAYRMPEDDIYLPVLVGVAANESAQGLPDSVKEFQPDNEGENISAKNPMYCELTALYWGWKNLKCDYCGLVHYRRHFASGKGTDIWANVLNSSFAEKMLERMASEGKFVILPKKRHYVIETLYSHYAHSHHPEDLEATMKVMQNHYPDYVEACARVMKRRSAHMFNMCIMRKELMDEYCQWLFNVLFRVEGILDISGYTDFDKRVFGRISELLLDVWIEKNRVPYEELPVIHMEGENWMHKIPLFLKRKFLVKK